ncbi:MAG: hypothetical protein V7459_06180 [Oceanicoccus sp.]
MTVLSGLLLASCVEVATEPVPQVVRVPAPKENPAAVRRAEEASQRHHMRILLASAERALASDRLTVPEYDNAYGWYQQVLAIDQTNAEAHWGMLQITERYLQLAEQAFSRGSRGKGEWMLQKALAIAATTEQIESVRSRFKAQPTDREFLLTIADLTARNDIITAKLIELALIAKKAQSRLLIVARNDAEGRWIYRKMREAVDGYRLRGNIKLGSVPRIVLLDLGVDGVKE